MVALDVYAELERLFFVDGAPTSCWLKGYGIVGISQGYPIAWFLCNLVAIGWYRALERAILNAETFFYLHDRFIVTRSWLSVETEKPEEALFIRVVSLSRCCLTLSYRQAEEAFLILQKSIRLGILGQTFLSLCVPYCQLQLNV